MVYCRSDAASLCLSCDRNVHSANALSKRHSRTLVCDGCNSQPATVRCIDEKVSLCQNCDWKSHNSQSPSLGHKKQPINCYSGCPSAAELSRIWSFILDLPSTSDVECEQGMGKMSINEKSISCFSGSGENMYANVLSESEDKLDVIWEEASSSMPTLKEMSLGFDSPYKVIPIYPIQCLANVEPDNVFCLFCLMRITIS